MLKSNGPSENSVITLHLWSPHRSDDAVKGSHGRNILQSKQQLLCHDSEKPRMHLKTKILKTKKRYYLKTNSFSSAIYFRFHLARIY